MKRYALVLFFSLILSSCEDANVMMMTDAASDAVKAVTLNDEEMINLARRAADELDSIHRIARSGSRYDNRLNKLIADYQEIDGHTLNFKVYLANDINAFATADGTVRVYSGLIDLMNDEELFFVIGHEIGHVVKQHSRQKVIMAHVSSALRKGLASQNDEVGQIARSIAATFAQQLTNTQFSQHEQRQTDQFAVRFLGQHSFLKKASSLTLHMVSWLAALAVKLLNLLFSLW